MQRSPRGDRTLVAEDVVAVAREADLLVLNLECCISERGERWPDPGKPFFFRAPPAATETLRRLGVSCVTLANNHALDFGAEALLDTFEHLRAAGIDWVGAGTDRERARSHVLLESDGLRLSAAPTIRRRTRPERTRLESRTGSSGFRRR